MRVISPSPSSNSSDSEISDSSEDFDLGNFTDCHCSCEKYQYFSSLLEEGEELSELFKRMDADELFAMAKWAAEELNTYNFGPDADDKFNQFFDVFFAVYEERLPDEQQQEIEVLHAIVRGMGSYLENQRVQQEFRQRLNVFLGDENQIASIETVHEAQKVAFALFGGVRNMSDNALTKHLARLFFIADDSDMDVIKAVMYRLRVLQVKYFSVNGFGRQQGFIDVGYDAEEDDSVVDVWVATGRQCYQSYVDGNGDGRFLFGSEKPGMVVNILEDPSDLKERARVIARSNFDEPILLKIQVAQRYIFEEEEDEKRVFIQSTGPFVVQSQESVPMVVQPLLREDLNRFYPDAKLALLYRLHQLLYNEMVFPHPEQREQEELNRNPEKFLKLGIILIGTFLAYKHIVRPFLIKVSEWWHARPKMKEKQILYS